MSRSSFDRVKEHLVIKGAYAPAPADAQDDLETLTRRCDEIRDLGDEFGTIELSPYMQSLLRVSRPIQAERSAEPISAAR